jgi:hypothetical protein
MRRHGAKSSSTGHPSAVDRLLDGDGSEADARQRAEPGTSPAPRSRERVGLPPRRDPNAEVAPGHSRQGDASALTDVGGFPFRLVA